MSEIDAREALALEVAREAGALAIGHWRNRDRLAVEAKASAQDMVSEADRAVERLVRARVAAAFPDDGFLGEEYGAEPGRSGFVWVIDPIDGTSPFLHGMPSWCVALAVAKGGEAEIAVTEAPTAGETFAARRGRGFCVNGERIAPSGGPTLRSAATGVGASHRTDPAWIGRVTEGLGRAGGVFFRNGSGALMLAYVAAGRLAGYVEPHMHAWDCLGGLLMVREAGGRAAAYPDSGDLARGGSVLAAWPEAWDDLVRLTGP